jgi:hypothetical protein
MKKIVFSFLMLGSIVNGQSIGTIDLDAGTKKVESIVYKKDGTQVKGTLYLISLKPLEKKIKLDGDKVLNIKNAEIDSIQIFDKNNKLTKNTFIRSSRDLYNAKKGALISVDFDIWMCRLIKGKVSLYVGSSLFRLLDGKIDPIGTKEFCVKRENEKIPILISMESSGFDTGSKAYNKYFKAYAPIYFSNNKTIVSKIESEEYKKENIETIVLEYNKSK